MMLSGAFEQRTFSTSLQKIVGYLLYCAHWVFLPYRCMAN